MFKRRNKDSHFDSNDFSLTDDKSFSFMMSSGQSVFRFSLSKLMMFLILLSVTAGLFFISYGVWFSFNRVTDYTELNQLRQTVQSQSEALEDFDQRFSVLVQSVEDLVLTRGSTTTETTVKASKKKNR